MLQGTAVPNQSPCLLTRTAVSCSTFPRQRCHYVHLSIHALLSCPQETKSRHIALEGWSKDRSEPFSKMEKRMSFSILSVYSFIYPSVIYLSVHPSPIRGSKGGARCEKNPSEVKNTTNVVSLQSQFCLLRSENRTFLLVLVQAFSSNIRPYKCASEGKVKKFP